MVNDVEPEDGEHVAASRRLGDRISKGIKFTDNFLAVP